MSKKHKQGRVIGRRVNGLPEMLPASGEIGWFNCSPEFKNQVLRMFGGEEGLREAMREACPICAVAATMSTTRARDY